MKRVLAPDMTAKSPSLADRESCFAGSLLELALAADRLYMLDDPDSKVALYVSPMNAGALPMGNGLSRLQSRFLKEPARVSRVLESKGAIDTKAANALGLVTFAPDDIDWDDEVRIAFEERASMSPDALTGMEASLRFAGPETLETKIFARLSAWQNWIFQRPNAVGERGALTPYGKPERPELTSTEPDFRPESRERMSTVDTGSAFNNVNQRGQALQRAPRPAAELPRGGVRWARRASGG